MERMTRWLYVLGLRYRNAERLTGLHRERWERRKSYLENSLSLFLLRFSYL
jgi:hypothetical protein